jgi:hypothetical protein
MPARRETFDSMRNRQSRHVLKIPQTVSRHELSPGPCYRDVNTIAIDDATIEIEIHPNGDSGDWIS